MGSSLATLTNAARALGVALAFACTVPSLAVAATPDQVGEWGPLMDFGVPGTHEALMHNGKVLYWRTSEEARVWDPTTGQITPTPAPYPIPGINFHCAAQVVLADGRVLAIGGQVDGPHTETPSAATFDPLTNTWTRAADMHFPRWYPTATVLSDGRVLVVGGEGSDGNRVAQAEVYDPRADTWTVLAASDRQQDLYAPDYLLPDGRVFNAAPIASTALMNVATGNWTAGPAPLWRTVGYSESGAMYAPGKVLRAGGTTPALAATNGATAQTAVIDMTAPNPQWQETSPMNFPRRRENMVVLADGSVMAVGGTQQGDDPTQAVLAGEIWSPATKTWTTVASMSLPRMYHSAALLLPDGRVLAAGGEPSTTNWQDAQTAQVYSPPYLFRGPRPTISAAPGQIGYGGSFAVATADAASIAAVALIRPAAVTHANDMDQRYVPLSFQRAGGSLTVAGPADGNVAPPGWYMLVIRNAAGVPSVASWVQVGQGFAAGPPPPPGTSPSQDPPSPGSAVTPAPPPPPPAPPGGPGAQRTVSDTSGTQSQQSPSDGVRAGTSGRVLAVTARRRLRLSVARAHGIAAAVQLSRWDDGVERVVRVRLVSLAGGRRRTLTTVYRTAFAQRNVRVLLGSLATRRSLRPGLFAVDAASGASRARLAGLVTTTVRITR